MKQSTMIELIGVVIAAISFVFSLGFWLGGGFEHLQGKEYSQAVGIFLIGFPVMVMFGAQVFAATHRIMENRDKRKA